MKLPIGRGRGARRKINGDNSHPVVGADRIRVAVNSNPRMLQPVPTPYIPVSLTISTFCNNLIFI